MRKGETRQDYENRKNANIMGSILELASTSSKVLSLIIRLAILAGWLTVFYSMYLCFTGRVVEGSTLLFELIIWGSLILMSSILIGLIIYTLYGLLRGIYDTLKSLIK